MKTEDVVKELRRKRDRLKAKNSELLAALECLESWRLAAIAGSEMHGGPSECLRNFDAARAVIIKAKG